MTVIFFLRPPGHRRRFLVPGLLLILFLASGCNPKVTSNKEFLMDTEVEIILPGGDEEDFTAAFGEMKRVAALLDVHNPSSEISRVNRLASRQPVRVSGEIFDLLETAGEYNRLTSGACDVSIRPLTLLWAERGKLKEIPPPAAIEERRYLVGSQGIILDEEKRTVRFRKEGMALDLGGIAKGYSVDRAIEILKERGISEALINAGGDIRVMGKKKWKVGLQHPRDEKEVLTVFRLSNQAVATSGDYQRYFIREGRRYHHIIDPDTGYPAAGSVSVTIIGPTAIQADILATGIFILGPEKGMELVESLPDVEGLIIDSGGKIFLSSGLKDRLRLASELDN
jgi:thiamine biosynthesis lipoprotein